MKYEIIDIEKLNYINITVSEKIKENYINEFILTTLKQNKILIQKKSKIFYTYLNNTNEYQITIYQSNKNYSYPIVNCVNKNEKGVNLSIHNKFFTVFINGILYYYQKIDSSLQKDEFVNYVQKRLNILIDNVYFITEPPIDINNKKYKNRLNYISMKIYFEMQLYSLYLILLIFSSFVYFYSNLEDINSNKTELKNLRTQYTNIVNNKKNLSTTSFHLSTLYKKINALNLKLLSLKFEKNTFFIKVTSLNKSSLYTFINSYKYKSKKQSLVFDSNRGYYVLDTTIKFM